MKFLWFITVLGAILGAITLVLGVMSAGGAPGEAAAAAIAVALAVIPYCLARACQEMGVGSNSNVQQNNYKGNDSRSHDDGGWTS